MHHQVISDAGDLAEVLHRVQLVEACNKQMLEMSARWAQELDEQRQEIAQLKQLITPKKQ